MKKLLILALIIFAGYKFYQNGFSFSRGGAFDRHGKPLVVLFVGPGCGEPCERIQSLLKARGIVYDEINVAGPDGTPAANKYDINRFPSTLIGQREIPGDDVMTVTAALAEAFGDEVLTPVERTALHNHFDDQGHAKVVMYATSWCPYCKRQRQYFDEHKISYDEIDVEASQANELSYRALQGSGYPLTYVGYRRFSGYQEGEILAAVDELAKVKRPGSR